MLDVLNQVLVPGVVAGATAGMFALAFVVMHRTTGVLNFAHGQLVMLLPLAILALHDVAGLPLLVALVGGGLLFFVVVLAEERVAIRPFIQSGHALPWILSTLGFSIVLTEFMAMPYQGEPARFPWVVSASAHDLAGFRVSNADLAIVVAFIGMVAAIMAFDRRTTAGLRLRAVSQDKDGAASIGIEPGDASRLTALIAGGVAAVTGLLIVSTQLVTPDVGLTFLFNGFVAAAVGGLDSLQGVLVGGLVVGLVSTGAATYLGGSYVQVALFAILLLVYLVRPHGIFGRASVRAV